MSWTFLREDNDGQEKRRLEVRVPQLLYLTLVGSSPILIPTEPEDKGASPVLGILNVQSWGAKLQAVGDLLRISPGSPKKDAGTDPSTEEYVLMPKTDGQTEIILLRADDQIRSPQFSGRLTLTRNAPQVQVNSSVTPEEIPDSDDPKAQGNAVSPEEETEDEEDLDHTIMPGVATASTPLPSAPRTEVVQETPTADRVNAVVASLSRKKSNKTDNFSTVPAEPGVENSNGSAKKNGRHPSVRIPAKRSSPPVDEEAILTSVRPAKRLKTAAGDDYDETTSIEISAHNTATKAKIRVSDVPTNTPSTTQRSSSRSVTDQGDYDGPRPCIAFSNSAITPNSHVMKSVKKLGGTRVETFNDDCNILCVKDGTLVKTMKLLQSIALGIPIVTDKWLMDSAKANRFLTLEPYKPHAPTQEKEWKFSLDKIWNQPQNTLFQGSTVYFTPTLKNTYKEFGEIEQVCKAVGARRVVSKKAGGKDVESADTIVLAAEEDDPDAAVLVERGRSCFSKDFLTNSILRGNIDLESDEFRIKAGKAEQPKKKGRSKKS